MQVLRTDHDRSKDHLDAMLMLAHRAKEAVLLDCVVRVALLNQRIQKLVKLGSRPYKRCVLNNSL